MTPLTPEGKLLNLIKQAQDKFRLKKELKLFTKINILLIVLIIVILAVFLVDVFTSNYNIPELSVDLPEEVALPRLHELDEDMKDVDIVPEKKVSIPKKELTKDLTLLGIITGDSNQAIIEDKGSKKTFFLYQGDSFGEFRVFDIKESMVILNYKGEKIELRI